MILCYRCYSPQQATGPSLYINFSLYSSIGISYTEKKAEWFVLTLEA